MVTWAMWAACAAEPEYRGLGSAEPVGGGDTLVEYDNVGVACVETDGQAHPEGSDGDPTQVAVDFGDCLFCMDDVELWCEAALSADGTTLEVTAGGSLVVVEDCTPHRSTCANTMAWCDGPALAVGEYTLSYSGVEVPVPAATWTCTGLSAAL